MNGCTCRTASREPRAWLCTAAALALAVSSGCSGDRPAFHRVQGVVMFESQPLAEATLTFERISGEKMEFARPSICISAADGTFAPWTLREGDGLPAGRYRVGVMAQKHVGGPPIRDGMSDEEYARIKWKSLIPQKYNYTETSGIEVEVSSKGLQPDVIAISAN